MSRFLLSRFHCVFLSFLNEFASLRGVGWIFKLCIWKFMYFVIVYIGHGKFPTSGWA